MNKIAMTHIMRYIVINDEEKQVDRYQYDGSDAPAIASAISLTRATGKVHRVISVRYTPTNQEVIFSTAAMKLFFNEQQSI